ncbi:hypothetical protein ACFWQ6_00735 [Streptomyces coelicoflavus]|uniref:hypothetical protein n=1 Tax=Streptomyces coelicoflavus TaxID=285562 RepID=UPI00365C847B
MGAVRLRNLGEAVHLYAPPGSPNSLPVDAGQVITVAGPLEDTDDAYLCGEGGQRRAFPKSRWAVEPAQTPSRSSKKTVALEGTEEKGGDS